MAKENNRECGLFIKSIKDTWIPHFNDGLFNYAQKDGKEWTNNLIESHHGRLQEKSTKNPSVQLFIKELQNEEK